MNARGFTLVELLIVVVIVIVVTAIAVPTLIRSRISGNEASAIGSIRTIVSAQHDYHGFNGGYAASLASLSVQCPGSGTAFLTSDLTENGTAKSGYVFSIEEGDGAADGPTDCAGTETSTTYYASARPEIVGFSGNRAFAANVTSSIWQDSTGVPPEEPFVAGGTISPLGVNQP